MLSGEKPLWLTFDCYGTLIQWDEGVRKALTHILQKYSRSDVDIKDIVAWHDNIEHELEQSVPFMTFRKIVAESLGKAMAHFGVSTDQADFDTLLHRSDSAKRAAQTRKGHSRTSRQSLESQTKVSLMKEARSKQIPGRSRMNKAELIAALSEHPDSRG